MTSYNASYRKDRYLHGTSQRKGRMYLMVALVMFIMLILISFYSFKKVTTLNAMNEKKTEIIALYEQELAVLRTINPYQNESGGLVQAAIENSDVFPGWVTRVYPLPQDKYTINQHRDFGSFIMSGTQFTLASHQMHGIEQPSKSMYRLSGLLPSLIKGRHQIGVEFTFLPQEGGRGYREKSKIGSCFAQIIVNHKRVIDKRVNIVSRFETSQVITGEVELGRGVFPIDAVIYCDEKSDFNDKNVEVSFSFRRPDQQRLTTRNDIFHIYGAKHNQLAQVL